jgi:hypothetical protein
MTWTQKISHAIWKRRRSTPVALRELRRRTPAQNHSAEAVLTAVEKHSRPAFFSSAFFSHPCWTGAVQPLLDCWREAADWRAVFNSLTGADRQIKALLAELDERNQLIVRQNISNKFLLGRVAFYEESAMPLVQNYEQMRGEIEIVRDELVRVKSANDRAALFDRCDTLAARAYSRSGYNHSTGNHTADTRRN